MLIEFEKEDIKKLIPTKNILMEFFDDF